ncbi:MAG: bifunctional oligoribonuclease/PAP phosphatase NrnA [Gemmatimonadetes bacterium]|nr:bifunctional oligoribonuclease/PAP phosphatase NrnA [Gemmatimonadota bacterium]NNM05327.1 bifunctional oligoribonuclease/PAP phosphatase NrnA [Gemmatimonadota bacterium]
MTYETPRSRLRPVEEALGALDEAERILLTTHINADGDGAGSEVGLAAWLLERGKKVRIINPTPFPEPLGFLLPDRSWVMDMGSDAGKDWAGAADLAVVLDTGEVPRIGGVSGLIESTPTIVIDHHPPGPSPVPGISLRDPAACATGELVFDLLMAAGGPWPRDAVRGLYVAILTDTGGFRFGNTSADAHRIVAFLLEKGAEPEALFRLTYGNAPLRKLRLLHAALGELEVDPDGTLAWMTVPGGAFEETGATADDIEGLVDYPRDIQGVEVGLLFRETVKGFTKVSFRSNGAVDVNALARRFGGGGHVKASGALVERPLGQVREEVLEAVRGAIRQGRGDV